jgi:hypothetical protein
MRDLLSIMERSFFANRLTLLLSPNQGSVSTA